MQVLRNPVTCLELLSRPYTLNVEKMFVRYKRPKRQPYPQLPPQFWRHPPAPGEPAKEYPLEAAPEEMKKGPYRLDRWTDWRMKKDWLRRQMVIRLGRERMMLDTIYNNNILPTEIREMAIQEVCDNFPRDSAEHRLVQRCALTSRARACVEPWRVSRMVFRHYADYNKLAGVQRGIWG